MVSAGMGTRAVEDRGTQFDGLDIECDARDRCIADLQQQLERAKEMELDLSQLQMRDTAVAVQILVRRPPLLRSAISASQVESREP